MTPPDAQERWARRILGGVGARPVGHADPDDGPQVPVQSPQPPAPATSPRITDWWRPGRPDIGAPPAAPEPVADDELDEDQEEESEEELVKPAPASAPSGPVEKVPENEKRTGVRKAAEAAADDRTMRMIMFNLSAGGVGYGIGLVPLLGDFLPAAEHGAIGMFQLTTAVAGGYAAWWCTRFSAVRHILPVPPLSRAVIMAGAAEIGRRLAPLPVVWLNQHGQRWGLGPSAISLLLTTGSMCGGLYWLFDRRTRSWHWLGRWIFRIPLASALLATALYAPGNVT